MRALPALLLLAACQVDPDVDPDVGAVAQPVVGAELDTADPGVVALVTTSGSVFCSGTLISPSVILTAAHCIDDGAADPDFSVYFGPDVFGNDGARVSLVDKQRHPMWTGDLAGGHDIGVMLLAAPQDPAWVVPMNTDDIANHVAADYRVVGFGIYDRDTRDLDGKKRTGVMSIARLASPDYFEAEDPDTIICQGDSGGPGFITVDGVEHLAGTHSYSIAGCSNPSGDARVDLWHDDFILPYVVANDTTCGLDGLCARVGCPDDPDCQPCGADGTCATDCALPDVDCATGAVGDICRADTQCLSGLCVYWDQDPHSRFCSTPCDADGDCPDGMSCTDVSPFGRVCYYDDAPPGAIGQACDAPTDCSEYVCEEGVCTYACDLGRGLTCPDGFECDTHDGERFLCWALPVEEDGGCCSTGGRGPSAGTLLLIALVALRFRRCARRHTRPS